VALGDTIHNYASIYFDFNLPIVTNNAFTVVKDVQLITLPVKLLSFSGIYKDGSAQLQWRIAEADNLEKFEVERSLNSIQFTSIGTVSSKADHNITATYAFDDDVRTAAGDVFYYRLKMVDKDGSYRYSPVISIQRAGQLNSRITLAPNPVINRNVTIRLENVNKGRYELTLFTTAGQMISAYVVEHGGGSAFQRLLLPPGLVGGLYGVQIKGDSLLANQWLLVK
jgi:hypothetical protein